MKYAASLSAISLLHIGLHKPCQPILAEPRIYIGADTRYSLHLRFDSVELLKMLMEIGPIERDVFFLLLLMIIDYRLIIAWKTVFGQLDIVGYLNILTVSDLSPQRESHTFTKDFLVVIWLKWLSGPWGKAVIENVVLAKRHWQLFQSSACKKLFLKLTRPPIWRLVFALLVLQIVDIINLSINTINCIKLIPALFTTR